MGQSLGLALYLALRGGGSSAQTDMVRPDRPSGLLVWLHAPSATAVRRLNSLIHRIQEERPDVSFLLTVPAPEMLPERHIEGVFYDVTPTETLPDIARFLDHWQPDLCLWSEGYFLPGLISSVDEQRIPLFLINAEAEGFQVSPLERGMYRSLFDRIRRVFAVSEADADHLRRLGAPRWRIEVSGALQESTIALPCNENERDTLAGLLAGRPTWLAAQTEPAEENSVLEAHRLASRAAHRLLLILVPADPSRGPGLAKTIASQGFKVNLRSLDEEPDEDTQIYIADIGDEMGLWYRLCPTTYMGRSMSNGGGCDPLEPAALGSAILAGPNTRNYFDSYTRLIEAGAVRRVRDTATLARAVEALMLPETTAVMAHAAWDVCTQGAEVLDRVIALVTDTLDTLEVA
ncbi:MAG: glycosyltransferase N-terminal domain-containing protein [Pseudomonadota bacterium]